MQNRDEYNDETTPPSSRSSRSSRPSRPSRPSRRHVIKFSKQK